MSWTGVRYASGVLTDDGGRKGSTLNQAARTETAQASRARAASIAAW
jgi:hypothetical protein